MKIKKSVFIIFILLTIISIMFLGYKLFEANTNKKYNPITSSIHKKFDIYKKMIIGKEVKSLANIISKHEYSTSNYILAGIYTGLDCDICVKNTFKLKKYFDSLYHYDKYYFLISSNSNIGYDQVKYDYYGTIYSDNNETIRSELKFIPTPVVLLVNDKFKIEEIYFPFSDDTDSIMYNFIDKLKSKFNKKE